MSRLAHRTQKDLPRLAGPAITLFLSMFAGQAGLLVLAPILPEVSHEFGVSTATAGQLRVVSGIAGGLTAIALARLPAALISAACSHSGLPCWRRVRSPARPPRASRC